MTGEGGGSPALAQLSADFDAPLCAKLPRAWRWAAAGRKGRVYEQHR